ncbi:hypothetical protein L596_018870 [Steinernema carpocapsae]|uniref:Uncharacterized protein n=1 Tax=Steinernema carpocapsae TaxID=34508 RepID=A0A4U5N6G6_STECR|nr:hypothetical protein L596_018870 [Steinernema carpocapsae]
MSADQSNITAADNWESKNPQPLGWGDLPKDTMGTAPWGSEVNQNVFPQISYDEDSETQKQDAAMKAKRGKTGRAKYTRDATDLVGFNWHHRESLQDTPRGQGFNPNHQLSGDYRHSNISSTTTASNIGASGIGRIGNSSWSGGSQANNFRGNSVR